MYAITTTYTSHQTGQQRSYTVKRRYPTQTAAQMAAKRLENQYKPCGHTGEFCTNIVQIQGGAQ